MTLEERIENLELELERTRRQRRVTWGLAAVVIVLGVAVIYPQGNIAAKSDFTPEIRARQIVLVDENGKPRCILAMGKEGPGLAMNDEKGEPRAVLDADKNGSGLALYDETGNPRVGLFVGKDGPKLTLLDKKGKEHWSTPATK